VRYKKILGWVSAKRMSSSVPVELEIIGHEAFASMANLFMFG
jgi:hypothetical protein